MGKQQLFKAFLLLVTAFIWGSAFVAQSEGAKVIDAYTFLAMRSWLGGFFLIPVIVAIDAFRRKHGLEPVSPQTKAQRKTLVTGGMLCGTFLFAASLAQQIGIETTTTAKAGFITALYVLIVPILALFLGRRVRPAIWLCVLMGLAGLYLLCIKDSLSLSRGDTAVAICALLFSGHILVIDHFAPRVDGVRLSCIQFFVTAVISTILMLLYSGASLADLRAAWLPIAYAGIFSSGIAYTLQIIAQRGLNPAVASLIMCMESVFSALCGWLIQGQKLTPRELAGCALMFVAIVIAQLPSNAPAERPQAD